MNNHLVSVNILSFNRRYELSKTLTKVFEQDYKNIEVIVVDNASMDGTQEMVRTEFPEVKLIELKENIGIAGWNRGFEAAKGEYVLVLDDDSYPEHSSIAQSLQKFKADDKIGIVVFDIFNTSLNFSETENWTENPFSFVGCGALINLKKLKEVGYYDESIFIYLNELELTSRFLNKDYRVVYCPECKVIHAQSFLSRGSTGNPFASKYRYENYFWSMTYILLTKFSFPWVVLVFLKWLVNRFLIALRYLYIVSFFRQALNIICRFPLIMKNRKPLKKDVQRFYHKGNVFAWIDRDFFSEVKG